MAHDYNALMRRWFDEVWNRQIDATIPELCHPECDARGLTDDTGKHLKGPEGFRIFHQRFLSSFSNINITVEDAVSHGDKSACRFIFRARHSGPGLGIPPTDRDVVATGMVMLTWKDGKMIEAFNEFDTATLLAQIQQPLTTQVMA